MVQCMDSCRLIYASARVSKTQVESNKQVTDKQVMKEVRNTQTSKSKQMNKSQTGK